MIFTGCFSHNQDMKEIVIYALYIRLEDGSIIECEYDTGEWIFLDHKTEFRLQGIYFDGVYANGKWEEIYDSIKEIFIAYGGYMGDVEEESLSGLQLIELTVDDNSIHMPIPKSKLQRDDHIM